MKTLFTSINGTTINASALSQLNRVHNALQVALATLTTAQAAGDADACQRCYDELLDKSPLLSALSGIPAHWDLPLSSLTPISRATLASLPRSGLIIAMALAEYEKGNRSAIRFTQTYLRNDTCGNDHNRIDITFCADGKTATASMTVVETRDTDGDNYELALGEQAHWVHVNGEPVEAAEKRTLTTALESCATDYQAGGFGFISAPSEESLSDARATLERYAPLLSVLNTL